MVSLTLTQLSVRRTGGRGGGVNGEGGGEGAEGSSAKED